MTAFLNGLRNESRDVAVSQLLHYLPLLRPANSDGVRSYVHLLPSLLASFLEDDPQQQSVEIQQLLTYALIHPAISLESKRSLAEVIRHLDEDGAQEMALSLLEGSATVQDESADVFHPVDAAADTFQTSNSAQWDPWKSYSSVLASSASSSSSQQRIRRSNSLTPPSAYPSDLWSKPNDNARSIAKPRSQSLSSPSENGGVPAGSVHCPLSPQNSLASSASGSDSIYSDDNIRLPSFQIPGSGMRDVPVWLKGLRLHKYSHLFSLMSYEDMLSLTEEQLELQGVTKGARHKIALSIIRLRERPALLAQLEKEVVSSGNVVNALNELKTMLTTPIKPYHGQSNVDEHLFVMNSLTPSPLMMRDDTSGYSSLEGSVDNLAPRLMDSVDVKADVMTEVKSDVKPEVNFVVKSASEMPTVIVSAAPDSDSAEEGSDSSGDDCIHDAGGYRFNGDIDHAGSHSPVPDDDLCSQITRLLGKICTQLLVSAVSNEESIGQFIALLERCLSHGAFTQRQRCLFASWKEQAHRIFCNTVPAQGAGTRLPKNTDSRYARRWSNIAQYPGFYSGGESGGIPCSYGAQTNGFNLFPPRQQQQQRLGAGNNRQFIGQNSHNSYGQHHHHLNGGDGSATGGANCCGAGGGGPRNLASTTSLPLNHSLQVGSHLPLQHRNSFCVSALSPSQPSPLYQHGVDGVNYSSLSTIDPYLIYSDAQHPKLDRLPSQSYGGSGPTTNAGRSHHMAGNSGLNALNNGLNNQFYHDKDLTCDIDLNHRLESLCLSMTEHALEGANDS